MTTPGKNQRWMQPLLLWLALTFCFSMANHAYVPSDMVIHGINSLLFVTGYYLSYRYLVQPVLYRGQTTRFVLYYLLVIAGLSLVSLLTNYQVYVFQKKKFFVDNYWSEPVFIVSNYILVLLVTSTLLGFRFLKDKMRTQVLLENLEKEKISTELEFLKAQVNPHFLFNSLNNILFQIDKSNSTARETLLKFSEMLRYQLYECGGDLVDIGKELQYLKNYVEIQMLRKTEKYDCSLHISDCVRNFRIAPFILIPFVENAFKHVSNRSSGTNSISISMEYGDGIFVFSVRNDKDTISPSGFNENKGIGLMNVQRRLDLLYAEKHELAINDTGNQFTIALKMDIDKSALS